MRPFACVFGAKESLGFKGKGWGSKSTPGFARQRGYNTQHTPPGMKHGMHHTHDMHHTVRRTKGTKVLYVRLYKKAKDRRLPDGGAVDGDLMV